MPDESFASVSSNERVPWSQIVILMAGTFMAFLDTSIINVAIPKMMSSFGVGENTIQWVSTAYLLSAGVSISIIGYFSDRFGLKNIFIFSITVFTLGSALCSVAQNETFLVMARAIQAVGGGAIMPVTTAYIYHIVPKEKIGMALGIRGIAMAMGPAMGPALGGYLVDRYDWHIIFTINIPVGVLVTLIGLMSLPQVPRQRPPTLDLWGALSITTGSFCLLLALSRGQAVGWGTLFIVSTLLIGCFSLILFVLWELSAENPLADFRIFKGNPVLGASFVGTSILTITLYASMFLIPIFVQRVMGFTPYRTGLLMLPGAIVMGVLTPIVGRLFDKVGALPLCVVGIPISVWSTYQLGQINLSTSFHTIQYWVAIRSVGFALTMMPITVAGLNTVPRKEMNRVTSINSLVRQISGALGIAYFTYVLNRQEVFSYALYAQQITINRLAVSAFLSKTQNFFLHHVVQGGQLAKSHSLALLYLAANMQSNVLAIDYTLILSAIVLLAMLPLVFFLRQPKRATVPPEKTRDTFPKL